MTSRRIKSGRRTEQEDELSCLILPELKTGRRFNPSSTEFYDEVVRQVEEKIPDVRQVRVGEKREENIPQKLVSMEHALGRIDRLIYETQSCSTAYTLYSEEQCMLVDQRLEDHRERDDDVFLSAIDMMQRTEEFLTERVFARNDYNLVYNHVFKPVFYHLLPNLCRLLNMICEDADTDKISSHMESMKRRVRGVTDHFRTWLGEDNSEFPKDDGGIPPRKKRNVKPQWYAMHLIYANGYAQMFRFAVSTLFQVIFQIYAVSRVRTELGIPKGTQSTKCGILRSSRDDAVAYTPVTAILWRKHDPHWRDWLRSDFFAQKIVSASMKWIAHKAVGINFLLSFISLHSCMRGFLVETYGMPAVAAYVTSWLLMYYPQSYLNKALWRLGETAFPEFAHFYMKHHPIHKATRKVQLLIK